MIDPVHVDAVTSRRHLKAFVKFPWRVYRGDELWVPPLISERLAYLDPEKGPLHGEVALFTARRHNEILGTIAAFVDRQRIEHIGRAEGGFGFFEVVNEYDVAGKLLSACCEWLRTRGMLSVRGPTNFGDNDCPGVLLEGTEFPPAMLEAHTPMYYRDFLERFGMQKENDLFAWRATFEMVDEALNGAPSDIVRVAEVIRRTGKVKIRRVQLQNWEQEVPIVRSLFNDTISQIPDGVPLSETEFRRLADQMRPFLDEELALIAEIDGRPVGYCVLIPDTNRVLARLNGRLLPFKWLRIKQYIRDIEVVSFKLMGVRREYQRQGVDALLYVEALTKARERGYAWLDGSLTSELNPAIDLIARGRGAQVYKHYRLYRMDL